MYDGSDKIQEASISQDSVAFGVETGGRWLRVKLAL